MREIKFRAWNKKDSRLGNRMIYGVYLSPNGEVCMPDGSCENLPIMQYTGLHDKNGKEIYEGDIVEYQYLNTLEQEIRTSEVKLLPLGDVNRNLEAYYPFCYCIGGSYKDRNREVADVYLTPADDCVVIGNIYQNPELLEINQSNSMNEQVQMFFGGGALYLRCNNCSRDVAFKEVAFPGTPEQQREPRKYLETEKEKHLSVCTPSQEPNQ